MLQARRSHKWHFWGDGASSWQTPPSPHGSTADSAHDLNTPFCHGAFGVVPQLLEAQKPPGRGPGQPVLIRGTEEMASGGSPPTSTTLGLRPQLGTSRWHARQPPVLTLARHHPLRVALGQQPRVAVEAGLLHFRRDARRGEGGGLLPQPKRPAERLGLARVPGDHGIPVQPKATTPTATRLMA